MLQGKHSRKAAAATLLLVMLTNLFSPAIAFALTSGPSQPETTSFEPIDTTDMVNEQTGQFVYNMPLLNVPSPEGGYPLSLNYHSGIMPSQEASWVGLGWGLNPGAINRVVNGVPDDWYSDAASTRAYWVGGTTSTFSIGVTVGIAGFASVGVGFNFSWDTYKGFGVSPQLTVGLMYALSLPTSTVSSLLGSTISNILSGWTDKVGLGTFSANFTLGIDPYDGTVTHTLALGYNYSYNISSTLVHNFIRGDNLQLKLSASIGFSETTDFETGWKPTYTKSLGASLALSNPVTDPNSIKSDAQKMEASDDPDTKTAGQQLEKWLANNVAGNKTSNWFPTKTLKLDLFKISNSLKYPTHVFSSFDAPSYTIGGVALTVNNAKSGQMSTHTSGFKVSIPIFGPVSLSLGYSKQRYWINQVANVNTHGSMWINHFPTPGANDASDQYGLLDNQKNIVDYPDPNKVEGGSFPDFDAYNVTAQGLGGDFRPYMFQNRIWNQNIVTNGTTMVTYSNFGSTEPDAAFRFVNDFSNTYRQAYTPFGDPSVTGIDPTANVAPFDPSPSFGYHDANGNPDSHTALNGNTLTASRSVSTTIKVHPTNALGYVKTERYKANMTEGYSITNASGMTYHYALPAYSYGEENYQEQVVYNSSGAVQAFNRGTKPSPYAYTWYLTSITGPDYVDRNNNGIADDADWGYWVNFEYGKWSDNYIWRTPGQAFTRDEDNNFQDCSVGYREVYYLNEIRTRTHAAIFEKSIRNDAKSEANTAFDKVNVNLFGTNIPTSYTHPGVFDNSSVPSMKLSHIYLLNAADENFVSPSAGGTSGPNGTAMQNVIDESDVNAVGRSNLEAKAIRVIDFNYDYSLAQNTANSFVTAGQLLGKLTLLSVMSRGKGGAPALPPTRFQYDLGSDASLQTNCVLTPATSTTPATFAASNATFQLGDMVMNTTASPSIFCGVIVGKSPPSGGVTTYTLKNCAYTGSTTSCTMAATKNPNYDQYAYDSWGMYKSDYDSLLLPTNENLYRNTSVISSAGTDAWNLRVITTAIGDQIKVGYEAGQIGTVDMPSTYPFTFPSANPENVPAGATSVSTINVVPAGSGYNINDYFQTLGTGTIIFGTTYTFPLPPTSTYIAQKTTYTITSITTNTTTGVSTLHLTLGTPIPLTSSIYSLSPTAAWGPGNISANVAGKNIYGGNCRVNKVSLINTTSGSSRSTSYTYTRPDNPASSSGVTSYLPGGLDVSGQVKNSSTDPGNANYNKFARLLYADIGNLYPIARELPPPGIMYEYVGTTEQSKNPDEANPWSVEGSSLSQFEVFRTSMVGERDYTSRTGPYLLNNGIQSPYYVSTRNMVVQRFTAAIGQLKRLITYDANGAKLTEMINHYLHDGIENLPLQQFTPIYQARLAQYYNNQGFLQERYAEMKQVFNQPTATDNGVMATFSAKEEYPCIQTGTTLINYSEGTQSSTQTLGFDYYSGQITQELATDAYGNSFLKQTIPAYQQFSNASLGGGLMGLPADGALNLNMLTQAAATYLYKVDPANPSNLLDLVAGTATDWSDQVNSLGVDGSSNQENITAANPNVWRPRGSYTWVPNVGVATSEGLTPASTANNLFSPFNFSNPSASNSQWKQVHQAALFDVYSNELQSADVNGNASSVHLGYKNTEVVLTGTPANYYEIAYSGAEDEQVSSTNTSFVLARDAEVVPLVGHTGSHCLILGSSATAKGFVYTVSTSNLTPGRNYVVNVWTQGLSTSAPNQTQLYYTVNGVTRLSATAANTHGKSDGLWTLLTLPISATDIATGSTLEVGCINNDPTNHAPAYLDDFKFQPANATVTAFVYDPFSWELTDVIDNNDLYTRYVYDPVGRLLQTFREKLNTGEIKKTDYQYNMGGTQFQNQAQLQYFTKNSCPAGQAGSIIPYNVPAGRFYSGISSIDAFNQAMTDINTNGQEFANETGGCFTGGNIQINASLPAGAPVAELVFFDPVTNAFQGNVVFGNGTSYYNIAIGNHNIQVVQLDGISRTTTIAGYPPVSGSGSVSAPTIINNVATGISQLTVTITTP